MFGYSRVRKKSCSYGCHRDEKIGAKVCAEARDEAGGRLERDLLFDVEIETVELVSLDKGAERLVICFKLGNRVVSQR